MSSPDYLYTARNNFYIGNYETTIEEAKKLVLVSENDQIERTTLILRSYIALGRYDEALQQIAALPSKSVLISAIELLANYFRDPENRTTYVEQMSVLINDEFSTSPLIPVIAATMFNNERDYEKAYRLLRSKSTFEQMILLVQTLLNMNRIDLASRVISEMKSKDEDNVLTQLAVCWVDLVRVFDGTYIREATQNYIELIDKFGQSVPLLVGLGLCNLKQGKGEEAYNSFMEAYDKDPKNCDVLNNLVLCCQITGKSDEETSKYLQELLTTAPQHPTSVAYNQMQSRLQEIIQSHNN